MSVEQERPGGEPEVQYQSFAAGCLPWIVAVAVCSAAVIGCALWAHAMGWT